MSENKTSSSRGVGFTGLLTLVFITLKLCGVIAWSWWWVLSPIWIAGGLAVIFLVVVIIGYLVVRCLRRPRTSEERVAAACRELSARLATRS